MIIKYKQVPSKLTDYIAMQGIYCNENKNRKQNNEKICVREGCGAFINYILTVIFYDQ